MLKLRELKHLRTTIKANLRTLSTKPSANVDSEYTETPQYPEILDVSYKARKKRVVQASHEQMKKVATVEEKLIKLNMPRYYGFPTVKIGDSRVPYNCLPLTQHYTRTVLENVTQLPECYATGEKDVVDTYLQSVRGTVEDLIGFATLTFRQKKSEFPDDHFTAAELDRMLGAEIVTQLNRFLLMALCSDCSHLSEAEVDLEPRHEAFWFVGGVNPPEKVRKSRDGVKWQKEFANEPIDRAVQYTGRPYLALRHKLPLKEIRTMQEESREIVDKVPLFKYDPRTVGYASTHRHGTTIPGFWPGSSHEFGLLSYQCRDYLLTNPDVGPDTNDLLHAHGIQSSFGWLFGQACYQGFSTYNDITYPLSTQTVITNGQYWSFYVYQMNTTLVHTETVYNNPKVNYCWAMDQRKLYEEIDDSGKCIGFNEDVLKTLIHFYANKPVERVGVDMKPYLDRNEQKIADIKDDKRRIFLEQIYKHLMSNRPRHRLTPETYTWEKIYKIDHKTRPMEAKRRFFELGENPFKRTLDQHIGEYIPRDLRPLGRRSKIRFDKTYYP